MSDKGAQPKTKKRARETSSSSSSSQVDIDKLDSDLMDPEILNKIVDQAQLVESLDSVGLKRMLLSFERALTKNRQLRIKYPRQPDKFVDSEVDLDEEIKKMHVIASAPHLYPEFIQLKAHESILSLLIHDNTDITVDALDLLRELTDSDTYDDSPEHLKNFVEVLLENQILELLVSNLSRLSESSSDEKSGVYNILSIIENLIEVKIELCEVLGEKTEILSWMLTRIQNKEFDEVKLYSSEILSILLQNSQKNQIRVGKLNGIDIMLLTVAKYKKTNPPTTEEEEFVENIFNCLCTTCPLEENKKYFTQAEGLKLLQIMIKNKRYTRKCALKLLDYVLSNDVHNCRRWVQLPGLGTLFAAFMKKGSKKHKKGYSEAEDDEHIISIIASLFRTLESSDSLKLWNRVFEKFRENDNAKVERLLELREKYHNKMKMIDAKLGELEELDEEEEEERYLERLDAGLFTLQLIDYVIGVVCRTESQIKEKVCQLLTLQDSSFEDVKRELLEYAKTYGGTDKSDEILKEKNKIIALANELTVVIYQ